MPMIDTKVSVPISTETEERMKEQLGKAIALLPGKSEKWLMLRFEENARLWFQGNRQEPSAFVEVKVFGSLDCAACDRLTAELTRILGGELSIPAQRVYVKYETVSVWGWNGANF